MLDTFRGRDICDLETRVTRRRAMSQLPKILVVEDDDAVARSIARAVRRHACVARARSVAEAIQLLDTEGSLPLILDVKLTDGSGFDVLSYARSIDRHVPALVLSGDSTYVNRAYT